MNTFFNWLCNPVAIYVLIVIAALGLHIAQQRRKAIIFFGIGIFWILLVSSSPFPQWIVNSLEKKYQAFSKVHYELKLPVYILVLGGGHSHDPDMPASMKLSRNASVRLMEGLRIYRQIDGSKLVGSGSSLSKRTTLAETQSIAAIELGVESDDTLQNREPKNTSEEILAYKKRFGEDGTLILVTSAIHMPRAMTLCKKYGLEAIPAPTEFYLKRDDQKSFYDFKPSVRKMEMMESALHEYAGLVKANWMD
jgi:uncharacterized SAM-binding protein YcdF (DUF218 family)